MEQTLVTMAKLAALIGVTRQQVSTWYRRRASNGFPEPIVEEVKNEYKYMERQWDQDTVLEWHRQYVPSRGGRPRRTD